MFVEPEGWEPVKTKEKSECTKIERFEYALERELYYANKGVSFS